VGRAGGGARAAAEAITTHAWRVLAVTSLGVLIVLLDTTIVNIAFPAIAAAFPSTTRAALSWVLNAYAIVFAALLVTAGRIADLVGRRRVFLTRLAIFAATSAACGLAPTLPALVGGRALQAVGAALLVPTSLALLLASSPGAGGRWRSGCGARWARSSVSRDRTSTGRSTSATTNGCFSS